MKTTSNSLLSLVGGSHSFKCALSGHVVVGHCVHALDVNGVMYPISNTSYVRITDEISRVACDSDEQTVGVVRITNGVGHVEFCVNLRGLRLVSNWRQNIDHVVLDSEQQTARAKVEHTCSECAGDEHQAEFSFV